MDDKIVQIIIAIILPPLAVYLDEGKITKNFWVDLALWIFIPIIGGVLYALYIILK
jgi:uncharacterized membrane protein YqaE (UPF0057 family)